MVKIVVKKINQIRRALSTARQTDVAAGGDVGVGGCLAVELIESGLL